MLIKRLIRIHLGKLLVSFIGIVHSIFVFNGLTTTLREATFFERDEDLQNKEKIEGLLLFSGHFLIIFCLFYSVYKNAVSLLLPWLVVMFLPFLYITLMVLRGLKDMKLYLIPDLISNFIYTGLSWMMWSIIYFIFKTGDFRSTEINERICNIFSYVFVRNRRRDIK